MKAKEKVQGFVTVEEAIEMDYETTKEQMCIRDSHKTPGCRHRA